MQTHAHTLPIWFWFCACVFQNVLSGCTLTAVLCIPELSVYLSDSLSNSNLIELQCLSSIFSLPSLLNPTTLTHTLSMSLQSHLTLTSILIDRVKEWKRGKKRAQLLTLFQQVHVWQEHLLSLCVIQRCSGLFNPPLISMCVSDPASASASICASLACLLNGDGV